MYVPEKKIPENKSKFIPEGRQRALHKEPSEHSFLDNRSRATTQNELKKGVDNSTRILQLKEISDVAGLHSRKKSELNTDSRVSRPVFQFREVHNVRKATTPFIHEFTEEAIDKGAPTRLTYVLNKNSEVYVQDGFGRLYFKNSIAPDLLKNYFPVKIHELNRMKALKGGEQLFGKSKTKKSGEELSRDEYPYASTMEGGKDSFWAYVPKTEQNIQGGQLSGLYRRVIESGDPEFDVQLD